MKLQQQLQMGQQSSKLQVLTLNYSGIYLSPFEFYAVDNWQQLEEIGIIFQNNIRQKFNKIQQEAKSIIKKEGQKQKIQKQEQQQPQSQSSDFQDEEGKKVDKPKVDQPKVDKPKVEIPKGNYYDRATFNWDTGKLDKEVKCERFSPLYYMIQPDPQTRFNPYTHFAGVIDQNFPLSLMNEQEFMEAWEDKLKNIKKPSARQIIDNTEQAQKYLCKRFDFECYCAFIEYFFNRPSIKYQLLQIDSNQFLKFEDIVQLIKSQRRQSQHVAIEKYCQFMQKCFLKIDQPRKIEMTYEYLFSKWDVDIICLQEVDQNFRKKVSQQNKYFIFQTANESQGDQCLLLIKKNLSFIPEHFRQWYQQQFKSIEDVSKIIKQNFKDSQSFNKQQLIKIVEGHFNNKVSARLKAKINLNIKNSARSWRKYKQHIQTQIYSQLMNPMKGQLESWLENYKDSFLKYWKKQIELKPKMKKKAHEVMKIVKNRGIIAWTEAFNLTTFQFTNRNLQNYQQEPKDRLIFGSFHLSSNEVKNRIQVQIFGLLIYELMKNNFRFVFGGDYNSHITPKTVKKDEETTYYGLFTFLEDFYKEKNEILDQIKSFKSKLNIYPKHMKIITTKKKRTILQVQASKSNVLAEKCIDQVITNTSIDFNSCTTGEIGEFDSTQNTNKKFVPHLEHPYDHFAVKAILDLNPKADESSQVPQSPK